MLLIQPTVLAVTLTIDSSDYTGATSKLPKILLNGNNICMVKLLFSVVVTSYVLTMTTAHSWRHARGRRMIPCHTFPREYPKQVSNITITIMPALRCISYRRASCANTQSICPSSGQCMAILATKLAFALPQYAERDNYSASAARHLRKPALSARVCTMCIPVPYSSLAMKLPC